MTEIFQLDWQQIHSEADIIAQSHHLQAGVDGQSCLLSPPNSKECLACFNQLNTALERVEKTFWSFSNLLQRFDCRLVKRQNSEGLAATTRPFSPNTTCYNCAVTMNLSNKSIINSQRLHACAHYMPVHKDYMHA